MLTLNKEQIVKIIEADSSYNKGGRYCRDFANNEMTGIYDYNHTKKMEKLLAFSGREMSIQVGDFNESVAIIADDGRRLLVKEIVTDEDDFIHIEFWVLDKITLRGDTVWEYTD